MLEHQPPAINRFMILTPTPVSIDLPVFSAATALLDMKVVAFVIQDDYPPATVAPNNT
jgi:hypothetical protein